MLCVLGGLPKVSFRITQASKISRKTCGLRIFLRKKVNLTLAAAHQLNESACVILTLKM